MRKSIRCLVAAVFIVIGALGIATPAHAALANSAACDTTAGYAALWYVHNAYDEDHNGTLHSWATVVPANTTAPPQDRLLICFNGGFGPVRVDEIDLMEFSSGAWQVFGVNYETSRTIGLWGNTVKATLAWCDHAVSYKTRFWYYLPGIGSRQFIDTNPYYAC